MKTKRILPGAVIAMAALTIAAGPAPEAWNVDASHTGINFSVKHFFTPVQGQFDDYEVDLVYDRENPANSSVTVRIDVSSIETHNERRNNHLLSGDFFEADLPAADVERVREEIDAELGLECSGARPRMRAGSNPFVLLLQEACRRRW